MKYHTLAWQLARLRSVNRWAKWQKEWHSNPINPLSYGIMGRSMRASFEVLERHTRDYEKPAFGIRQVKLTDGQIAEIEEEVIWQNKFCRVLHFKKNLPSDPNWDRNKKKCLSKNKTWWPFRTQPKASQQQKILLVAPLSGHYATLLRGTVECFLPDTQVFITDWHNSRDISCDAGAFHLDDYIDYLVDIFAHLGPDLNVVAVCQSCVPAVVALTKMAMDNLMSQPKTMTLIGGPIDVRQSPTEVNYFAKKHNIHWFERHVICRVPPQFPGRGRRVYPGFLQLSGFLSMNLGDHMKRHLDFFKHLVQGDGESAEAHRAFYDEYLAVMDLPAEYYLETIEEVFLKASLAQGNFYYHNRKMDLTAVTMTRVLTVEGERDDITGRGQTQAALTLFEGLSKDQKQHYEQKEVGHYGLFNGRRFREQIYPVIRAFQKNRVS